MQAPTTRLGATGLLAVLALLASCHGCPVDDGRVAVEPLDVPLGAMYFCPYWPMHALSGNCNARADAPCAYAGLGLPRIKLEAIRWDSVEPSAPSGGQHSYDWSVLDDAVLRWEEAGARQLQFHVEPHASWGTQASRPIAEEVFGLDCDEVPGHCEDLPANPEPQRWEDWRAFVTALCERYDGDGVDDVEGLLAAHLEFELLNEGQNWQFYMGSAEDYAELLAQTRQALDACNERAQLIHYGVTFNGLTHGGVSDEAYWERQEQKAESLDSVLYGPGYRHAHAMMLGSPEPDASVDATGTLSLCADFEQVDLNCNMSIAHMIEEHAFLRAKLDGYGCEHVQILCGDSTSAPALYSPTELEWWDSSWSGADTRGEALHAVLGAPYATYGALCNPDGLDAGLPYDQVKAWYDQQHAAWAVKKAATALALGMTGFMAGLLENWPPASGCYWMYQGMSASEVEALGLLPVSYGAPEPVYRSYRLLAEKLAGYARASRAVVDGVTVLAFAFEDADKPPLWLVWYLDDALPEPGAAEQTHAFTLDVGASSVRITRLITEAGVETPSTETFEAPGGLYTGEAGQTPFFVEAGG
ncbi:MAG: hypothetical protein ABIO70_32145 [Pseudomonadota bacterium]